MEHKPHIFHQEHAYFTQKEPSTNDVICVEHTALCVFKIVLNMITQNI